MTMTSRERMLTALGNGRPDRLPCQVHGWMDYYLKTYLGGADWYEANRRFGFDYAIYVNPDYRYDPAALENWQVKTVDLGVDADGNHSREEFITTPGGTLHRTVSSYAFTTWDMEPLLKTVADFELWNAYCPLPVCGCSA